ncbi:hypothetical protein JAAARDRAFT_61861 [Jaapia argillacea MUCL 33604]|uniref:Transcription regulator Rua1 C-terminal domain-containing protein n=1 Tax=Jaapia argillacea MUCL 33604 TaxID=933084 RepID=A0A067PCS6_9AGAM|nr:hypothetical protein JAAARDRAFT_61861 [Jaapia argillacea MUCL 33604]
MKTSAFNYHLQYSHGISSVSALPFSPPLVVRVSERLNSGKHERDKIAEGKCHKCKKWIPIEGVKDVDVKTKEIYWWKHAAGCHQGSSLVGERDFYLENDVYKRIKNASV